MRYVPAILVALGLAACGGPAAEPEAATPEPAAASQTAPEPVPDGPVIVAFGDSLTEGYGLPRNESYPARLQQELIERGYDYRVVNEGVSGDTTSGGLTRIDIALAEDPEIVILALGANDGLRGLAVDRMEANLRAMIERIQASGAKVLLAGMRAPPNMGPEYEQSFREVFPRLAKETGAALMPFLLVDVAAERDLNQDDEIHPNAAGARIVAKNVADALEPLLAPQ